jgi:3-dehydroquinate synthase
MHAAGRLSQSLGLLTNAELERQQSILTRCGLPDAARDVELEPVLAATLHDKKVAGGKIRWVLLAGLGNSCTRNDVSEEQVVAAARPLFA